MDSRQRATAEAQLRVLELLEVAMERRDEVFAIVDSSEDDDEARVRIRQLFEVPDPNISQAVLDQQCHGGRAAAAGGMPNGSKSSVGS